MNGLDGSTQQMAPQIVVMNAQLDHAPSPLLTIPTMSRRRRRQHFGRARQNPQDFDVAQLTLCQQVTDHSHLSNKPQHISDDHLGPTRARGGYQSIRLVQRRCNRFFDHKMLARRQCEESDFKMGCRRSQNADHIDIGSCDELTGVGYGVDRPTASGRRKPDRIQVAHRHQTQSRVCHDRRYVKVACVAQANQCHTKRTTGIHGMVFGRNEHLVSKRSRAASHEDCRWHSGSQGC